MKLVLLFFCGILVTLVILFLLILLSSIKLNIKKCYISNIDGNIKKRELDKEFLIYLEFYLLGIVKIAKIRITKERINKLNIKQDFKDVEKDIKLVKNVHPIEIIKKLKIKLEKITLYLEIGTDECVWTAYIVAIISSIIGIIMGVTNPKTKGFRVLPLYNFGNSIKFNLNCIINVKIVHIIYVIYILLKRRRKDNGRTSNRRAYDYSYE